MHWKWPPLVLIFITGFCGAATAESPDQERCALADPELSISSCTAIIDSPQEPHERLAIAFYNRGTAYTAKNQYDRAVEDLDQAIRLKPNFAEAFYNRGNAYAGKGQYDRAIED
jgi:tetratricopeptide (TPR) repeat protein